jgi:hypothetical protein
MGRLLLPADCARSRTSQMHGKGARSRRAACFLEVGTSEAMTEEVEVAGSEFVNQDMSTRLTCGESSSLSDSSDGASESYRSSLSSPSDILGSERSSVATCSVPASMPVSPVTVLWRETKTHMMFRGRNYKVPLKRHGSKWRIRNFQEISQPHISRTRLEEFCKFSVLVHLEIDISNTVHSEK